MTTWNEFVEFQCKKSSCLNGINICFHDSDNFPVSHMLKVSISLLEEVITSGNSKMVFVFPENRRFPFLLSVLKLIKDIINGDIRSSYNPNQFTSGGKLKYGNCVVEYIGTQIDSSDLKEKIYIKFKNMERYGVPVELAPYFQKVDTNRELSKFESFVKVKKTLDHSKIENDSIIRTLKNNKTHMTEISFYISKLNDTLELINSTIINGKPIQDILLTAKLDYDGNIHNLGKGQLAGHPTFIAGYDLYSVLEAIKYTPQTHFVFIDISSQNSIFSQLDALDELVSNKIPIICTTDTVNSFDLDCLIDRGFDIWRWNADCITPIMCDSTFELFDSKVKNCSQQNIEYVYCSCDNICMPTSVFMTYRKMLQETVNINEVFMKMMPVIFSALRNIKDYSDVEIEKMIFSLTECKAIIENSKRYITPKVYMDLLEAIDSLSKVFTLEFIPPKVEMIKRYIKDKRFPEVSLIIPENMNKVANKKYWTQFIYDERLATRISIFYPTEFSNDIKSTRGVVFVCAWLNEHTMRRVLFSNNASKYIVFLYDYEKNWKAPVVKSWGRSTNNSSNRTIIEKVVKDIDIAMFEDSNSNEALESGNELDDLEMSLKESKFKRYLPGLATGNVEEIVEAIPINYIGGHFSFYRLGHKLITVTDIILNNKSDIKMKLPNELETGDFIVIRESQHDVIREIADVYLINSGKAGCREVAGRWRTALEIAMVFSPEHEIFEKLVEAGCDKTYYTMRQWLKDDDKITPQNLEDINCIARATDDDVLLEQAQTIYEAGKVVRKAHVQAGKYLSEMLKRKIAEKLMGLGYIDPYNLWDPISFDISDIGKILVLKVIDIGETMEVEASNTNRLLIED